MKRQRVDDASQDAAKRSRSSTYNQPVDTNKQDKKPRVKTCLERAKDELEAILPKVPDARIYQFEYSYGMRPFKVLTFQQFCGECILNENEYRPKGDFLSAHEFYDSDKPCPLIFDVEWYNPVDTALEDLIDVVSILIDALIKFIDEALYLEGHTITRDDVCVEESCKTNGRKASFHIKVPKLVFHRIPIDMKDFGFYFSSWLYRFRDDFPDIPDNFFYQTTETAKLIDEYNGGTSKEDIEKFLDKMKRKAESTWNSGTYHQYTSCGLDLGPHRNNSCLRMCGLPKPGRKLRFLRPCMVTDWWKGKVDDVYLSEEMLTMKIPPKECRRAWTRASLLTIPWPDEETSIRVRTPQSTTEGWRFILDTTPYPSPPYDCGRSQTRQQQQRGSRTNGNAITGAIREGINDRVPFVYTIEDGRLWRFEKRDEGGWYDVVKDRPCTEDESLKVQRVKDGAVKEVQDPCHKHSVAEEDRRLTALKHMEEFGITYTDSDKPINYAAMNFMCETIKQRYNSAISLVELDDRAQDMLFTANDVTIDPYFPMIDNRGVMIRFGDITEKTIVYCPKHEIDLNYKKHKPSAFVGVTLGGKRFLRCSGKGCNTISVWETRTDRALGTSWDKIKNILGAKTVKIINVPYIELEHVFNEIVHVQ